MIRWIELEPLVNVTPDDNGVTFEFDTFGPGPHGIGETRFKLPSSQDIADDAEFKVGFKKSMKCDHHGGQGIYEAAEGDTIEYSTRTLVRVCPGEYLEFELDKPRRNWTLKASYGASEGNAKKTDHSVGPRYTRDVPWRADWPHMRGVDIDAHGTPQPDVPDGQSWSDLSSPQAQGIPLRGYERANLGWHTQDVPSDKIIAVFSTGATLDQSDFNYPKRAYHRRSAEFAFNGEYRTIVDRDLARASRQDCRITLDPNDPLMLAPVIDATNVYFVAGRNGEIYNLPRFTAQTDSNYRPPQTWDEHHCIAPIAALAAGGMGYGLIPGTVQDTYVTWDVDAVTKHIYGPPWETATSRGNSASWTLLHGIKVNAHAFPGVGAMCARLVGTVASSAAGKINFMGGASECVSRSNTAANFPLRCGIWNHDNREERTLTFREDRVGGWLQGSTGEWQYLRGDATSAIEILRGLDEDDVRVSAQVGFRDYGGVGFNVAVDGAVPTAAHGDYWDCPDVGGVQPPWRHLRAEFSGRLGGGLRTVAPMVYPNGGASDQMFFAANFGSEAICSVTFKF